MTSEKSWNSMERCVGILEGPSSSTVCLILIVCCITCLPVSLPSPPPPPPSPPPPPLPHQVMDVTIMREKGTEKPRGFGFAIFEDTDVVDKLCIKRYVRIKVSRSHHMTVTCACLFV